jgi:hypothetical protein
VNEEARKVFSSEEKKQKTFESGALPPWPAMAGKRGARADMKVFWFFSSEKNML